MLNYTCKYCLKTRHLHYSHQAKSNFAFWYLNENGRLEQKNKCYDCVKRMGRDYRKKTKNKSTHVYEKTVNGFLMRAYRNMIGRTQGLVKPHLYLGKAILKKEDFYNWAKNDKNFKKLFKNWVNSKYSKKLSPSVNRKNTGAGYTLPNIEWITHSENSRLGSLSRKNKINK